MSLIANLLQMSPSEKPQRTETNHCSQLHEPANSEQNSNESYLQPRDESAKVAITLRLDVTIDAVTPQTIADTLLRIELRRAV